MAGIIHGVLTGGLVVSGLAYATATHLQSTSAKTCKELRAVADVWENRNAVVLNQSNIKEYHQRYVLEGAKDLWNDEVVKSVQWFYSLNLGDRAAGLITGMFK